MKMMNKAELRKELKQELNNFKKAYLRLVELFELDDNSVDYLTEEESYNYLINSFAPVSFDELSICEWADRIEELIDAE